MALTSPAVSSQDAAPITPETTTGATFFSKEKLLNAAPTVSNPGPEPPAVPTAAVPDPRPPGAQDGTLSLGPEPAASQLNPATGETSPPANRAEAVERPLEEQKLPGEGITGALATARNPTFEDEGIAASQAERETFGYWRSERSQAKKALEGLETTVGSLNEKDDVIGEKALVEPEKITYWRQGRVADPANFAPAALAVMPSVLTDQAKGVGSQLEKAVEYLKEDIDGEKPLIEPEKMTYWRHPRVADPANYAPAALAAMPSVLTDQAKGAEGQLEKAVEYLKEDIDGEKPLIEPEKMTYWRHPRVADPANYAPAALAALPVILTSQAKGTEGQLGKAVESFKEDVDGGKALIEPDQITYWRHPRVADPAKNAAAALAALSTALTDVGKGMVDPPIRPEAVLPPAPSIPFIRPDAALSQAPAAPAPPIPPRRAAREYSLSEYSDYRSSIMTFHSSDRTLSSGQRRPQPEARNTVSSPYL
jgi:transcriptional antiterminator Rof (Rho-off)